MSESRPPTGSNPPVPLTRLKQIANDACFSALEKVTVYDHSRTESWNNTIINHILRALISESTSTGTTSSSSGYKFSVNSTIIQHMSQRNYASASTGTEEFTGAGSELVSGRPSVGGGSGGGDLGGMGRRGMHSACGAYWNNEKDGMWSFKYETKGMDVVISVIWIAV